MGRTLTDDDVARYGCAFHAEAVARFREANREETLRYEAAE